MGGSCHWAGRVDTDFPNICDQHDVGFSSPLPCRLSALRALRPRTKPAMMVVTAGALLVFGRGEQKLSALSPFEKSDSLGCGAECGQNWAA